MEKSRATADEARAVSEAHVLCGGCLTHVSLFTGIDILIYFSMMLYAN
jgi:hypothetical protein